MGMKVVLLCTVVMGVRAGDPDDTPENPIAVQDFFLLS
jgi:hypothetical protein